MTEINDRELERIAGRLGQKAATGLDVEGVARGVLARLRAARLADASPPGPRPALRWLAVAAALMLLVAGSVVTFGTDQTPPLAANRTLATDLYDLSSDELSEVLDSLAWNAPVSAQFAAGIDDLNAEQLRELLDLMEG